MATVFIDPGRLRSELALQQSVQTADGLGGFSETWVEMATLFGQIEPIAAREVFGAGQTLETVTHRITVRWRHDLKSGMRLSRLGRSFDVLTVHDPDETGRYLACRVREIGL
ncbi:MAG: phage head closure protein [Rhizobiaceae bacterium]